MRLALKVVSLLILLIVVSLFLDGWLTLRRERAFLEQELQRKAFRIGDALKEMVANVWQTNGSERALALIDAANKREHALLIRWVWLDASRDDLHAPRAIPGQLARVQEEAVHLRLNIGGQRMLVTYVGVTVDSSRPAAIELSEPLTVVEQFTRDSIRRQFYLATTILLVGGGLTLLVGIAFIGAPLQRLTEKAQRVGQGDLTDPVEVHGRDELSQLGSTINQMCTSLLRAQQRAKEESEAKISAIEQLRHADRLQTVGQLASGVAHELGTPLNVVSGRAQLISGGRLSDEDVCQSAEIIRDQADHMAKIIRQLLDFSRRSASSPTETNLRELAADTVTVLIPLAGKRHVELSLIAPDEPFAALVDNAQMQQVLTNLIVNALQATPDGGRITVDLQHKMAHPTLDPAGDNRPHVCITVEDTGEGIPESIRRHLFEPFFTTKQVGDGTGLGLSIAYGIVQEHDGWIEVDSTVGKGTAFRVYLPELNKPTDTATDNSGIP